VKGRSHTEVKVEASAVKEDGTTAARFTDAVALDFAPDKDAATSLSRPYRYQNEFELPAGKYSVRMSLRAGERLWGATAMPLVIEPWDGAAMQLSGLAIAAETRQVLNVAAALDEALLQDHRPLLAGTLETIPAGSNRCDRSLPCQAYIEVYDPGGSGTPELAVRIVDPSTGEQNLDSGPFSIAAYARPGSRLIPVPLTLPVTVLVPGVYHIEVRARRAGTENAVRGADLVVY
jgi:hypothetical protein